MDMLDKQLETLKAPDPSDLLKARILREAAAMRPAETTAHHANDNKWMKWSGMAAMALIIGFVGLSTFQNNNAERIEAELLADAANEMGYDTLFAWVHDDEDETINKESQQNETSVNSPTLPA